MFLVVATGIPDTVHDPRMLRSSSLYRKCESKELLIHPVRVIEGAQVRPLFLVDGADLLPKPFLNNIHLTGTQKKFNKILSGGRVIVDRAFGLLKRCCRCLLKRLDNENEYLANIILCFVLHNTSQQRADKFVDYENLLDTIICDEREERERRHQNPLHRQENLDLRDVLAGFVAWV